MLIDFLIVVFAISALYRGREIGFVRQLCSATGFFAGLFLGAWLQPHTISLVHTQNGRTLVTLLTTLGCAITLLIAGEYLGLRLKRKLHTHRLNSLDKRLGSVLNVVALLFCVWLTAAVLATLPSLGLQAALQRSHIISALNRRLPDAPAVIAKLGQLIEPNGFPKVFIGREHTPRTKVDLPSLGELRPAVEKDQKSVVKVQGEGCGGIVDGSGFVVDKGLVATNAHVVAGIAQPYVQDDNGLRKGRVVFFDENLDFALLRVDKLAGPPLKLTITSVGSGTAAAVLGYPAGGGFSANVAAVLDMFTARGRNIYGRDRTDRQVYEIRADVIPGNSGGPLVAKDGSVIGVIFAESTTYDHVGYALTAMSVADEIAEGKQQTRAVSTGHCAA